MRAAKSLPNRWTEYHYLREYDHAGDCSLKEVYQSVSVFQHAFKDWLEQSQDRLAVTLRIRQRGSRGIRLSIENFPSNLEIWVWPSEISIFVIWKGLDWDCLASFDLVVPVIDGEHIVCLHCTADERMKYKSLKAFWHDHLFERFARWINDKLAHAEWLSINETDDGGGRWAELHSQKPNQSYCLGVLSLLRNKQKPNNDVSLFQSER